MIRVRLIGRLLLSVAALCVPANAQTTASPPAPAVDSASAPAPFGAAVTWSAQYHSAQSASIGLSTLLGRPGMGGFVLGPVVEASAGIDAGKVALGLGGVLTADRFVAPAAFGFALQGTLVRTWRSTSAAPDPTTYAGVELRLTLSTLKLSGGCLWRVGNAPDSSRVRGTWGIGLGF